MWIHITDRSIINLDDFNNISKSGLLEIWFQARFTNKVRIVCFNSTKHRDAAFEIISNNIQKLSIAHFTKPIGDSSPKKKKTVFYRAFLLTQEKVPDTKYHDSYLAAHNDYLAAGFPTTQYIKTEVIEVNE